MGGPLVVVPSSALIDWDGFADIGEHPNRSQATDAYERACAVADDAGVIPVGQGGAQALVLRSMQRACYLPELGLFVHWAAADSEEELLAAAAAVVREPTSEWRPCGIWELDGPAVLMDSSVAGARLAVSEADRGGLPPQVFVSIQPGRWVVRAGHWRTPSNAAGSGMPTSVGLVQLLPEA
jgi:hypothetical protein